MSKWLWAFLLLPSFSAFAIDGGNEAGNGGDRIALQFVAYARDLAAEMQEVSIKSVDVNIFREAIDKTTVSSKERVFLGEREVDAANYPEQKKIVINRTRWMESGGVEDLNSRRGLILHEYLGIMNLDDSSYQISKAVFDELMGRAKPPQQAAGNLAVILGIPDQKLPFVANMMEKTIGLLPDGMHENYATTMHYSILADHGAQKVIGIGMLGETGSGTWLNFWKAIDIGVHEAPVIFTPIGPLNRDVCSAMAKYRDSAFVVTSGGANCELSPPCFAPNILITAAVEAFEERPPFRSCEGNGVRLTASGVNIPVIVPGGAREKIFANSAASSAIAGELSRFAQDNPRLKGASLIDKFLKDESRYLPSLKGKVESGRFLAMEEK